MESTLAPMAAPDGRCADRSRRGELAVAWTACGHGWADRRRRTPAGCRPHSRACHRPRGNTVFAASANGGVFISTNGAGIWKPSEEVASIRTAPRARA